MATKKKVTKEQQRIDEARFGLALLAILDLRQVEQVTKKYIEYRDEGWVPDGLGVPAQATTGESNDTSTATEEGR